MNVLTVASATLIVAAIYLYERPGMKNKAPMDKLVFTLLLLIGWILSMLDLQHMAGPTSWLNALFDTFNRFMDK